MTTKYAVVFPSDWWLRGYTAARAERKQLFASEADARTALEKAKKFLRASSYRAARIVPIEEDAP